MFSVVLEVISGFGVDTLEVFCIDDLSVSSDGQNTLSVDSSEHSLEFSSGRNPGVLFHDPVRDRNSDISVFNSQFVVHFKTLESETSLFEDMDTSLLS